MRFSSIFLSLVATVSAVDIRLFFGGGCSGGFAVCTNINPDTCCNGSPGNIFGSVGIAAIPTNWNVQGRGHSNGGCTSLRQIGSNGGTRDICLSSGPFSGGGYGFNPGKRAIGAREDCAKPDIVGLADGTKYYTAELEDASFIRMVCGLNLRSFEKNSMLILWTYS